MREHEESEQSDGGLDPQAVCLSVYNAYRLCRDTLGDETPVWEDLEMGQDAWLAAVNAGTAILWAGDETKSWAVDDVAKAMHAALIERLGTTETSTKFTGLPEHLRLLWGCLARHLCNMLEFDKEEDEQDRHEEQIAAIYDAKCKEIVEKMNVQVQTA